MFVSGGFVLGLFGALAVADCNAPTATLGAATLIGIATVLPSSTATVNKFLSIPYAVTPPKRFLPPERHGRYDGILNATQPAPLCIQQNYAHETPEEVARESEDCLYLNVYVPAGSKGDKAVMFWIHGGDLTSGTSSSSVFDGSVFSATQDVVVVTINYRVNAFGFSNAPHLPLTSRNAGFWDQRMALDWVQENIAAFGGDPRKVTIFGESSGASSVDRLLTTMLEDPPFRAAIMESGQATVSAFPFGNGTAAWIDLVSALNCTSSRSDAPSREQDEFSCVQKADALTIREIISATPFFFSPVNDNVTQIATPFLQARQAGRVAKVPLLAGTNGQEGWNLGPQFGVSNFSTVNEDSIRALLLALTGSATEVDEIMPAIYEIQSQTPWYNLFEAGAQLYTEVLYQCPCKLVVESQAKMIPTWRYYYNATIANVQPYGYPSLGAFHGAELGIVFGTYYAGNATSQEIELSAFVQKAWADFAKSPGCGPGWEPVGSTSNDLACLGCDGSAGVKMIPSSAVDSRCQQYLPFFTATTPYF